MRKKAFITGGSRGIGRGIVLELAKNGYDVAFTYNSKENMAKSLSLELADMGVDCFYYQASLQESSTPKKAIKKAISDLGGLDLLICNAGITKHASILSIENEDVDFLYGLNYRSYVLCASEAAKYMVKNNIKGNMIFISSTRGIRAYYNDSIYGSLKAAINRLAESFAIELAEFGIRVNVIAPGNTIVRGNVDNLEIDTSKISKIIPIGRRGRPIDVAKLVNFIASEDASYITGDIIKIDGGLILYGPEENI